MQASTRSVAARHVASRQDIADLVTRSPLPAPGLEQIDPFLLLNHHGPQVYPPDNRGLPFGPHPHRGFETVTFVLAGSLAHHDTGGHESVISAGGVQWMTAGSGLIHAEVSPTSFRQEGGEIEILQLWVNLPARLKMTEPRYSGVDVSRIPAVPISGGPGMMHLVSGEFGGNAGPIESLTGVFMSTVRLPAGTEVQLPAPRGRNVFFYVVRGNGQASDLPYDRWQLLELNDDGDAIPVRATTDTLLLFGHAEPIGEPVVAGGPFVMNTREEIQQAMRDYQAGEFNKNGKLLEVGV
jgi:redox-sensitive bicupin YhaK (pirin superfamily)